MSSVLLILTSYFLSICAYISKHKRFFKFIIIILLFIAIILKDASIPDYSNYLEWFNNIDSEFAFKKEPTFHYIAQFAKKTSLGFLLVAIIYALITLPLKLYCIKEISIRPLISFIFFIITTFILHDLIQFRAATSIAFFYLGIIYLYKKKKIKWWICVSIATLFHYSSVIIIPLYFLSFTKINKVKYLSLLFSSIILAILGISVISLMKYIPIIGDYYAVYIYSQSIGYWDTLSILAPLPIIRVIICITLLFSPLKLLKQNPYSIFLLKIYTLSLCCYFLLLQNTIAALRVSEFLQSVEIFLLPFLVIQIKKGGQRFLVLTFISFIFLSFYYVRYLLVK